jgi:hypothetical protein
MKRFAVAVVALALVAGAVPMAFGADSQTDVLTGKGAVSASLAEVGTRAIAAVAPITFTGTGGGLSGGLTSSYDVLVTEVARTGTNPWSITGQICGQDATVPTNADCSTRGNRLYSGATNNINTANVSASNQSFSTLTNGATVQGITIAGAGGGTPSAGSFSDLGAVRTLGSNAGQSNSTLYAGGYRAQGDVSLTAPNGTPVGAYLGYFVVTLIN